MDLDIYRLMPVNSLFARAFPNPPSKQTAKFEDRSVSTDDIAEDLEIVLARLDVCGVGTVVFSELPCPLKQVKCVRVLAPQLESVFEKSWYRPGERARALLATL